MKLLTKKIQKFLSIYINKFISYLIYIVLDTKYHSYNS